MRYNRYMKIYLASDHAGFALKEKLKAALTADGYTITDCGAFSLDPSDDYPDFVAKAAEAVSKNPDDRAIILGGSGEGEAMVANRYPNIRAVVFYGPMLPSGGVDVSGRQSVDPLEIIRLAREHNDANVLSLGARFVKDDDAYAAVKLWLATPFSNGDRHKRRISKF